MANVYRAILHTVTAPHVVGQKLHLFIDQFCRIRAAVSPLTNVGSAQRTPALTAAVPKASIVQHNG